jgi:hypothetical protein
MREYSSCSIPLNKSVCCKARSRERSRYSVSNLWRWLGSRINRSSTLRRISQTSPASSAVTLAARGDPLKHAISPKIISAGVNSVAKIGFLNQAPAPRTVGKTVTLNLPRRIMKAVLPGSPWRHRTCPFLILRRITRPCCQSKNLGGIPANMGSEINSFAFNTSAERPFARISIWATGLNVIALVGQETMHSPHWTQVDWPIGMFRSKPIPAVTPFPVRPMTWFSLTSSQARTQRSQRMQAP